MLMTSEERCEDQRPSDGVGNDELSLFIAAASALMMDCIDGAAQTCSVVSHTEQVPHNDQKSLSELKERL